MRVIIRLKLSPAAIWLRKQTLRLDKVSVAAILERVKTHSFYLSTCLNRYSLALVLLLKCPNRLPASSTRSGLSG